MTPEERTQFEQKQRKETWEIRRQDDGSIVWSSSDASEAIARITFEYKKYHYIGCALFLVKRTQTVEVVED